MGMMTDKLAAPRMDRMYPRTNQKCEDLPVYMQVSLVYPYILEQ